MNILILDYLPQAFCGISALYFAFQMLRWAEKGKYRWFIYGLLACLGVWAFFVAQIQAEALHLQDQALSMNCTTDYECEQLELAQGEENE